MNNSINPIFSGRVDQPYSNDSEPSSTPFTAIASRPNSAPLSYNHSGETSHSTQINVPSPTAVFEINAAVTEFLSSKGKISNLLEKVTEGVKLIYILTQRHTHEILPNWFLEAMQGEIDWRLLYINNLLSEVSKIFYTNAALKDFWIKEAKAAIEENKYEYEEGDVEVEGEGEGEVEEIDMYMSDIGLDKFSLLGPQLPFEYLFSSNFNFNGRPIFDEVYAPNGELINNMSTLIDAEGGLYLMKVAESKRIDESKYFFVEGFNPAIGTTENETATFTSKENLKFSITSKGMINHAVMTVDLPESVLNGDYWYFPRTQKPLELIDDVLKYLE